MRDINFRGRDRTNHKWYCGSLYARKGSPYTIIFVPDSEDTCVQYPVDPDTVGQFTGLYDKTGTGIYEGDIVATKYGRLCVVHWFESPQHCGFDLKPWPDIDNLRVPPGDAYDLYSSKNLEIVGNIHDNPDMLK